MPSAALTDESLKELVDDHVRLYGHRNWIVVADSAYPAHSSAGIETVVSAAGQVDALQAVLAVLAASPHVTPTVYIDNELDFVDEKDAPGVSSYRHQLTGLLKHHELRVLPHDDIISRLDQASRSFRVLIVKTTMTIPYTSVFLQLECAYWNAEAEERLRVAVGAAGA